MIWMRGNRRELFAHRCAKHRRYRWWGKNANFAHGCAKHRRYNLVTRTTCVRVTLFILPSGTQHSQVRLISPLSVLLSGGEELVGLFRELFFAGKFLVYVPKLRSGSKYSEQLRSPHHNFTSCVGDPKKKRTVK